MSARKPLMLLPLKVTNMIFSIVRAYSRRVGGLGAAGACSRPHQIAIVVVDVGSWVEVAVGREEDVARGDEFGAEDSEVYYRRMEIGSLWRGKLLVSMSLASSL